MRIIFIHVSTFIKNSQKIQLFSIKLLDILYTFRWYSQDSADGPPQNYEIAFLQHVSWMSLPSIAEPLTCNIGLRCSSLRPFSRFSCLRYFLRSSSLRQFSRRSSVSKCAVFFNIAPCSAELPVGFRKLPGRCPFDDLEH